MKVSDALGDVFAAIFGRHWARFFGEFLASQRHVSLKAPIWAWDFFAAGLWGLMFGAGDIVAVSGVGVERRIEVDEVDGFIFDVTANIVEVVAVVEEVLGERRGPGRERGMQSGEGNREGEWI